MIKKNLPLRFYFEVYYLITVGEWMERIKVDLAAMLDIHHYKVVHHIGKKDTKTAAQNLASLKATVLACQAIVYASHLHNLHYARNWDFADMSTDPEMNDCKTI